MSDALKTSDEVVLALNEKDILDSLSKFNKSMSKEEIARFNKIYA
jgi:hypothetical protein